MNILVFQLLSMLPHLVHGGERQSPSAAKTKKPLILHCEPHPKRETLEDPPDGEEPGWRLVKQSLAPGGWRREKREVGFTAGFLHEEAGRGWLFFGLSCAPALVPPCPGPALSERVLLCHFPAPMEKGGTKLERQRDVRMDESERWGGGGKQSAQHDRMCWEGIGPQEQAMHL